VEVAVAGAREVIAGSEGMAARARDENFPVASRLLPAVLRRDLMAVYGFARLVDDLGDEAEGDRLALLDWAEAELHRAVLGSAEHPVFERLEPVLRTGFVPYGAFVDLIEANRQDQRVHRYATIGDLRGYCMLSAAPVGRIVLGLVRMATPDRLALSDEVCIGLQVVEHLQDIGEDAERDRIYLPREDLDRFGCDESDLRAPRASDELRALVAFEACRARASLWCGRELVAGLSGRLRWMIAGFVAGGMAALDAIEAADFDPLATRCRPKSTRVLLRAGLLSSTRWNGWQAPPTVAAVPASTVRPTAEPDRSGP